MTLEEFSEASLLSFKVKVYNFEHLMHEPLSCDLINFSVTYLEPKNGVNPAVIPVGCAEINGALNFTLDSTKYGNDTKLENS